MTGINLHPGLTVMRTILPPILLAALAGCAPPGGGIPAVSFGPTRTVTVEGRDYAVQTDPVLRASLVAGGRDMADAMAASGGLPRAGAYEPRDTIRVAGAPGRDVALAVIAAWCRDQGAGVPPDLASAVLRMDRTTGEQVWPGTCAKPDTTG
jgi:hypothetical protein